MKNVTSAELYYFTKKLDDLFKMKKSSVKKFETMTFEDILHEDYYETPKAHFGYSAFIDLANKINSGHLNFKNWVLMVIGEFIKTEKIKRKNITDIAFLDKIIKLYTVEKINSQRALINKLTVEARDEDFFASFSENSYDIYKVNNQQKNKLYEMIKNGELNYYFFIDGLEHNKFEIDIKKIDDPKYKTFVKLMQIIRHNIKK